MRDHTRTVIGSNPSTRSPPAGLPAKAPIVPRTCGDRMRSGSDSRIMRRYSSLPRSGSRPMSRGPMPSTPRAFLTPSA
eukprot:860908-Pyramimonas_sp.AAC.1